MNVNQVSPEKRRESGVSRQRGVTHCISRFGIFLAVTAAVLGGETEARAYSDPGSGALLWQALLAGFFSLLFYIRRIKVWIQSGRKDKNKVE